MRVVNKVIKDSDVLEESEIISCLVSVSKSEPLFWEGVRARGCRGQTTFRQSCLL